VSLEQLLGLLRRDQQTVVVVVGAAAVLLSSGAALAFPYGRGSATGSGLTATAIAAGDEHTCALTITAGVKCWGRNDFGQLGNGTTTDRHTPVAVSGLASGVAAIASGGDHVCALTSGGAVKCWGDNARGPLGDGTTTERLTPVAVSGLAGGVASLAAGADHTCALTNAGGVKCWGGNGSGQLGDGATTDRHTPAAVSGLASGVAAIAASAYHTCALTSAGGVTCWGGNGSGQLGDGTTTTRHLPVDVSGLTSGIAALAAGDEHTCALTSAGAVKCWGGNDTGQLGDGTATERHTPVAVSGLASGVATIAAGVYHTCALTSAGAVKCWGENDFGQLGDGTRTGRRIPVAVSGLAGGVAALVAGGDHTCALMSAGGVKCWGDNVAGQLGDGTTTQRHTPVEVIGAPPPCVVPNVIAKLLPNAKTAIRKAHCSVGKVAYKRSPKAKRNRVMAESPKRGTHLKSGAKVTLTVGRGPTGSNRP
jgi:alpha-tubulin suppressor-like RCC1 family protein